MKLALFILAVSLPAAARADTLTAKKMSGPFPTLARACGATEDCPLWDEGTVMLRPKRVCDEHSDAPRMRKPPPPYLEVRLYSVDCRVRALRDGSHHYRVAARFADGWWLSEPLIAVGGNDKYCSGEVKAQWEARQLIAGGAPEIVLRASTRTECVACSKQGWEARGDDWLIVIGSDGGPASWPPIRVGEHQEQDRGEWARDEPVQCNQIDYHLSRRVTFDGDVVQLDENKHDRFRFVR